MEVSAHLAAVVGIIFLVLQINQANRAIDETRVQIALSKDVAKLAVLGEIRRSLDEIGTTTSSPAFKALRSMNQRQCGDYSALLFDTPDSVATDVEEVFRHYEYIFEAHKADLYDEREWNRICRTNLPKFLDSCGVEHLWIENIEPVSSIDFQKEVKKCVAL